MKLALLIGPAQSNEQGVGGTEYGASRTAYGIPLLDAGVLRSMWPMVSDICGRAGIGVHLVNRGVGSTGLSGYWTGTCRTWQSGIFAQQGLYVLSGGKVWKCTDGDTTSSVNPYGTSTVVPSASVGADNVQWQDMGAPTAEDVDGAVYARTSARFDPNGAIASGRDAVKALVGMDRRMRLISIADHSMGATRAQYREAYRQVTLHSLESGIEVFAGLTVVGITAGRAEWMRDVADPAWSDVCAEFAGTRGFHVGCNMFRRLATNPEDPFGTKLAVATSPTPGLQTDLLHMNSAAYDWAARQQAAELIRAVSEPGL